MSAVDVAAIRARSDEVQPHEGIVSDAFYAWAVAAADDRDALLSALEAAVYRAEVAEAALERVETLLNQPTRYHGAWPSWTLPEIEAAVRGDAT